jgi:hypothetical protein
MKKYKKIVLITILTLFIAGVIVGVAMYNKPHRNIQKAKTDFTVSATELLKAFNDNNTLAEKTYFGKVILVNGEIKSITHTGTNTSLIISGKDDFFGVNCSFNVAENQKINELKEGLTIKVKGECKGYLDDVILVDCYLIE